VNGMRISLKEVERLARLAKLEFPQAEKEQIARDLEQILDYIHQLEEVDTRGVEPDQHASGIFGALRPDRQEASLDSAEVLGNAPDRQGQFFRVPKVIRS